MHVATAIYSYCVLQVVALINDAQLLSKEEKLKCLFKVCFVQLVAGLGDCSPYHRCEN